MKRVLVFALGLGCLALQAQKPLDTTARIVIAADRPGPAINPSMWGAFFEDINFAADGGLCAELLKNRSFDFPEAFMGWTRIERDGAGGSIAIRREEPCSPAQPQYARIEVSETAKGFGLANEGFRGIGVRRGEKLVFSLKARAVQGTPVLRVALVASNDRELASAALNGFTAEWKKHSVTLNAADADPKARLEVLLEQRGAIDLDLLSLCPQETWKQRPNGLRADLVQMLADLKPGFLRFPGGCIVEGRDLANRYQWKNTIGPPDARPLLMNRWNVEFRHRPAPDYYQTFGLGFFEYFQLCEDLGAEPLPILNCGMACQYNTGQLAPLEELDGYIQDAVDLVEFANGSVTSAWGARRAALGHPSPFNLKLLGIGNEQWGPQYIERYSRFAEVLKSKHPHVQLIAAAGPDPAGERFEFLWSKLRQLPVDFVDEHYYRPPDWFFENVGRYDRYDRRGPKVMAGEYAAHIRSRANNLYTALAEAAMMTGFERNADVVCLAAYAPLFGHVDAWQWRPNLIWFDNLRVMGTPNYYVQQLFSRNRGSVVLPVALEGTAAGAGTNATLFASAARDASAGDIILKVVNSATNPLTATLALKGASPAAARMTETILTSGSLLDENSLDNPMRVAPETRTLSAGGAEFGHSFPAVSLTILRIPVKP